VGQQLETMAPLGNFTFSPNPPPPSSLVLVGAGSGIAAAHGHAQNMLRDEPQSDAAGVRLAETGLH
jgi:ring-1,2-phenylacetyl-CoA epoxidase subunit PaaE